MAIDHGGVSVATAKGLETHADDLTITPASAAWTEFEVNNLDGKVQIVASKGDLNISDGSATTTLAQGQQTVRILRPREEKDEAALLRLPAAAYSIHPMFGAPPWLGWVVSSLGDPARVESHQPDRSLAGHLGQFAITITLDRLPQSRRLLPVAASSSTPSQPSLVQSTSIPSLETAGKNRAEDEMRSLRLRALAFLLCLLLAGCGGEARLRRRSCHGVDRAAPGQRDRRRTTPSGGDGSGEREYRGNLVGQ